MDFKVIQRKSKDSEKKVFRINEENLKAEEEKKNSFTESLAKISPEMNPGEPQINFIAYWVLVGLSQLVAFVCIILVIYWGNQYGGFVFSDPDLMFNYHPLFMILGLVVFYGDAIIVYRVLRFLPKWILKIVHAALHIFAILFSSLALVAVFENHRRTYKPDMYSLHSWIGIGAFSAFCLQYVGSFVAFLYPGLPADWRSKMMPFHTFFGLGIFAMAAASAEIGITEKLFFTKNYSTVIPKGLLGNFLGLLILIFAFLIFYIATHPLYKRKPLPNEMSTTPENVSQKN